MSIVNKDINTEIHKMVAHIKKMPMDFNARLFLVQLYCLDADWDKALSITESFLKLQPNNDVVVLLKHNIINEIERNKVFCGTKTPQAYHNSPFNPLQLLMLQSYLNNRHDELLPYFDKLIQDLEFDASIITYNDCIHKDVWVDSDFRLVSVLEVFMQDQYFWLPLNAISSISFWENEILTDILWRRAEIKLKNNENLAVFIPARYPTTNQTSDNIKLNRTTEWQDVQGLSMASGQKMLTSGYTDIAFLDIKKIQVN